MATSPRRETACCGVLIPSPTAPHRGLRPIRQVLWPACLTAPHLQADMAMDIDRGPTRTSRCQTATTQLRKATATALTVLMGLHTTDTPAIPPLHPSMVATSHSTHPHLGPATTTQEIGVPLLNLNIRTTTPLIAQATVVNYPPVQASKKLVLPPLKELAPPDALIQLLARSAVAISPVAHNPLPEAAAAAAQLEVVPPPPPLPRQRRKEGAVPEVRVLAQWEEVQEVGLQEPT
mmetsp:Transcript_87776/g.183475  ORF Transcript_87776/g.183475 Transcript_87776/m.183475 type:complete len:234 (+) Transcript_87776:1088-1789(+)